MLGLVIRPTLSPYYGNRQPINPGPNTGKLQRGYVIHARYSRGTPAIVRIDGPIVRKP